MEHIDNIKFEIKKPTPVASPPGLLAAMATRTALGHTANGADTFVESGSACLDFFSQAGAMRPKPTEAVRLFERAFIEDPQLALRTLVYLRDVRGGQGERDLFRNCLEWLGKYNEKAFQSVLVHAPTFGRWDDIFFNHPDCFALISAQLARDEDAEHPSLLAKWLPTINASSPRTRAKARLFAQKLNMREQEYRRVVRDLRIRIATVEEQISAQRWAEINYSIVPGQASRIYRKAFGKHDQERYAKFLKDAKDGKVEIKTGTVYPYQIFKDAIKSPDAALEAMWAQLPNYAGDRNAIVMADVSGSMNGDPIAVSVSLALYFAERNRGAFAGHFMTFSHKPQLIKVVGDSLIDKFTFINRADWQQNTNLEAAFETLLDAAVVSRCRPEDMPSTIYIISDMEFDIACGTRNSRTYFQYNPPNTNFSAIEMRYAAAGYTRPNLVFWNVNASGKNVPVRKDTPNVTLISGFSPTAFKIATENKTPMQVMLDTVNAERYQVVQYAR